VVSLISAEQCRLFLSPNKPVSHKSERSINMLWRLLYSMPVGMFDENKPSQYDIMKIALPEKKHLIWNRMSY